MNMIVVAAAAEDAGLLIGLALLGLAFCMFIAPLALWVHLANFRSEQRARDAQLLKAVDACASSLAAMEKQIAPRTLVKILRPRKTIRIEEEPAAAET